MRVGDGRLAAMPLASMEFAGALARKSERNPPKAGPESTAKQSR